MVVCAIISRGDKVFHKIWLRYNFLDKDRKEIGKSNLFLDFCEDFICHHIEYAIKLIFLLSL